MTAGAMSGRITEPCRGDAHCHDADGGPAMMDHADVPEPVLRHREALGAQIVKPTGRVTPGVGA
jgi:hypothetical protein